MPWINHADYTRLIEERDRLLRERESHIRENERATVFLAEWERVRETCAQLTKDIERERRSNRKREDLLLDQVLITKGASPIAAKAERETEGKKVPPSSAIPLTALEEATLKMYIESGLEQDPPVSPNISRRMFERDRMVKLNPQADLSAFADLPIIKPPDEIDDFSDPMEVG